MINYHDKLFNGDYLINYDVGPHFVSSKLVYRVMK